MSRFMGEIVGGLEIAAGVATLLVPGLQAFSFLAPYLISAGAGQVLVGLGTLLSKGPASGFATTQRNPTAPWRYIYGRARSGGSTSMIDSWDRTSHPAKGRTCP